MRDLIIISEELLSIFNLLFKLAIQVLLLVHIIYYTIVLISFGNKLIILLDDCIVYFIKLVNNLAEVVHGNTKLVLVVKFLLLNLFLDLLLSSLNLIYLLILKLFLL